MADKRAMTLDDYLKLEYTFNVVADVEGGYVIAFPDLQGCMTQADSPEEIVPMAMDAKRAWLTVRYEDELDIPLPTHPEEYSGRFVLRMPKRLHRELAEAAQRNDTSLNTWIVYLLAGKMPTEGKGSVLKKATERARGKQLAIRKTAKVDAA